VGTINLVLENKIWLKTVLAWLRKHRKLYWPLFENCGGPQLIAINFFSGNQLINRENGLPYGTYEIHLTEGGKGDSLFHGMTNRLYFHFTNSYHIGKNRKGLGSVDKAKGIHGIDSGRLPWYQPYWKSPTSDSTSETRLCRKECRKWFQFSYEICNMA
jgi:hypothetical protein